MERYKRHFRLKEAGEEEEKSVKAIKDLIALDWGKDEDAQNTVIALFSALVYADTKVADKFIQDVSDFTSKMDASKYEVVK